MSTSVQDLTLDADQRPPAPPDPGPKVWFSFHWALAGLIVLLTFLFSGGGNIADPDIWWHLNYGQQIVTTGHFPTVDTTSFTANGSKWIDHEWLSEVPYYLVFKYFGYRGLYTFFLILACVVELGILYRSYLYTKDIKNSFVVSIICVLLTVVSFGPRMLIFGWMSLLVLLHALDRFREGKEKWIWVVPPLFCLWINFHGSWMIGLTVFAIIAGSGCFKLSLGVIESPRWTRRQMYLLGTVFGLSVLALFINPYGYHLVKYPFDMAFHQKLNIEHVEEWMSVNFHEMRGKIVLIVLAWTVLPFLVSRRKWRIDEILLIGLAVYSGLTYVRFLFLMAILISPFLADTTKLFPPYNAKLEKPILNVLFVLVCLGTIIYRYPPVKKVQDSVDNSFPKSALTYMRDHQIRGNTLNAFAWGGYISRFFPEQKVFIDSRVDIFEYNGTLQDYLDMTSLKNTFPLLDKHHIDNVLVTPTEPMGYMLRNTGKWDVAFEDKVSVLLRRKAPTVAEATAAKQ